MLKIGIQKLITLLCVAMGLLSIRAVVPAQVPAAYAAHPQVMITQPSVNNNAVGHAGTNVQIVGSGFGSILPVVQLYTTTSSDPGHCQFGDPNLDTFTTSPTVTTNAGGFTLQTTWPDNAAAAGSVYYICALSSPIEHGTLSSNTFTVAQSVTINVSPTSIAQGGRVTITGTNWLPPQPLNVSIIVGTNGSSIVNTGVNSDAAGNFTVTLTVPRNAQPMTYSVRVYAPGENTPAMMQVQNNVVTVTAAATPTPTPTATPSPTPSPTRPASTPTAMPTQSSGTGNGDSTGSGGITTNTFLLFALGGLGILLVIVGVILFVMYSRGR